ncbi:MAG: hypothetical protein RQ875_11350 [Vicingaceae bacterium]|nr:hypothetical protein [Vicingaceae bacterium]
MLKIITISTTILILISCNSKHNVAKTEIFSNYLEKIDKKIPKEKHLYILTTRLACSGCVHQLVNSIEKNIHILNNKNISIITSNSKLFSEDIISRVDYYLDVEENLDYINLDLYNITLIETKGGYIEKIIYLKIGEGSKFIDYIKKYSAT